MSNSTECKSVYGDENLLHREDAPAIIAYFSGHKEWYKNGIRHRDDGPAREFADGKKNGGLMASFIVMMGLLELM